MEDLILHPDIAEPVMTLSDRGSGDTLQSAYDLQMEGRRTKRLECGGGYGIYIHSDKNGYGNRGKKRILPETAGKRKTWRQTEEKSRGKQGKEIKLIF